MLVSYHVQVSVDPWAPTLFELPCLTAQVPGTPALRSSRSTWCIGYVHAPQELNTIHRDVGLSAETRKQQDTATCPTLNDDDGRPPKWRTLDDKPASNRPHEAVAPSAIGF